MLREGIWLRRQGSESNEESLLIPKTLGESDYTSLASHFFLGENQPNKIHSKNSLNVSLQFLRLAFFSSQTFLAERFKMLIVVRSPNYLTKVSKKNMKRNVLRPAPFGKTWNQTHQFGFAHSNQDPRHKVANAVQRQERHFFGESREKVGSRCAEISGSGKSSVGFCLFLVMGHLKLMGPQYQK